MQPHYTGFGIIYEGLKKIGVPGGIWDKILSEYMDGQREKPIWAMGEIDYHHEGEAGGKRIEEVRTVFLLKEFNTRSVIEAMKLGKMYAMSRTKEQFLSLDEFTLQGKAFIGDKITFEISGHGHASRTRYSSPNLYRGRFALIILPWWQDCLFKIENEKKT